MAKSLVIVESPAKAKTINKYLGKNFIVKSSVGHVRDLPTKALGKVEPKKPAKELKTLSEEERQEYLRRHEYLKLVDRMGVDPEKDWKAHYQVLQGKEKVVNELKKLAKDADTIYLATDLDREGEAIAWHLRESIGGDDERYRRVVFNEITKKAISAAFEKPGQQDRKQVNAQQAETILRSCSGLYACATAMGKGCKRAFCRASSVGGCSSCCGAGKRDSCVYPRRILGSSRSSTNGSRRCDPPTSR